jgi:hypothetical protein
MKAGSDSANPSFYRRRLPHWQPGGVILFVTCRLIGSLPAVAVRRLAEERQLLDHEPVRPAESRRDRALRHGRRLFELADDALTASLEDQRSPIWLEDERIARMVRDSLKHWDGVRYRLHRDVVMPNHVHLLIEPLAILTDEAVGTREVGSPAPSSGAGFPACHPVGQALIHPSGAGFPA